MSCNGCRVLRKGCGENCILRPCLQWIDTPDSQGRATVFVAKFFGRAGLMAFISAVPESQRPALFQSLLYEACGRTVNPVNGAVGLLCTGNWPICQAAVDTVLRGGSLRPIPKLLTSSGGFGGFPSPTSDDESSKIWTEMLNLQQDGAGGRNTYHHCRFSSSRSRSTVSPHKRKRMDSDEPSSGLDLSLIPNIKTAQCMEETKRPGSPSMDSDESVTMTSWLWGNAADELYGHDGDETKKVLRLFV